MGSTTSGHSNSTATAPAECRSSAATPTPSTAVSAAYNVIAPTKRHISGSTNDMFEPTSGGAIKRPTITEANVIASA